MCFEVIEAARVRYMAVAIDKVEFKHGQGTTADVHRDHDTLDPKFYAPKSGDGITTGAGR